ncbi:MAG TPA: DUF2911 domain-containing protein [Polyangia bacterium]|jgi:hypothetical protein|nr:DUF2911 domain-containing protein [Polyangia bacterium]HWE30164.1 DUF2911 domain-containing protein [Polyangia bacterium]
MKKTTRVVIAVGAVLVLLGVARLYAADKRASPHAKVSTIVAGKTITIEYGRPYKKGRDIFGALVPWGEVWRTGADEATTFTVDGDVTIGDLKVPKGRYSLFTIPKATDWQLIINKEAKQWGAFKYDEKKDVGRTALNVTTAATPVEQLTIALQPAAGKVNLTISWDKTVASAVITP